MVVGTKAVCSGLASLVLAAVLSVRFALYNLGRDARDTALTCVCSLKIDLIPGENAVGGRHPCRWLRAVVRQHIVREQRAVCSSLHGEALCRAEARIMRPDTL